jgi:hypothetical protein
MLESKVCSLYSVVAGDSMLTFDAKSSLHAVHGRVTALTGSVDAGFEDDGSLSLSAAPRMHVEFSVEQLRSGNDLQDKEMWKMIDSRRFPLVSADLRSIESVSGGRGYIAAGDITLAGRVRPYSGTITVKGDGERLVVDGGLTIDIRDFGLKPPQLLFIKVDPIVKVSLHLVATAAAAAA